MDNDSKIRKLILRSAYVAIIILIIAVICLLILKYQVEGEKNLPFKLSSIIIISNAEGYEPTESNKYKWNTEVYQNNDIYLNIEKNKNYKKTEAIKSVKIDNIKIDEKPQIGNIEFYRPNKENSQVYDYKDEYKITNKIEYTGDKNADIKNLKISNQGNSIFFRVVNKTGKQYLSNEDVLEHSGKLLNNVGILYENIKAKISFDLIISLESDISFKATIMLDLPVGDITKEGSSSLEITNMKDIIFKRNE